MVVILSCPIITWIVLKSAPFSSKWVAKECLKVWGLIFFDMPAFSPKFLINVKIIALVNFLPFLFRKTTSDGSFLPDPRSYDTVLQGGDFAFTTARGINPEEIIVDGDDFVSPTTSKGPEEQVPGQVLDTVKRDKHC